MKSRTFYKPFEELKRDGKRAFLQVFAETVLRPAKQAFQSMTQPRTGAETSSELGKMILRSLDIVNSTSSQQDKGDYIDILIQTLVAAIKAGNTAEILQMGSIFAEDGTLACGHKHNQICQECESIPVFESKLLSLVEGVEANKGHKNNIDDIDAFKCVLQHQHDNFHHYIGHKIRLCHEAARRAHLEARCRADAKLFLIVADYAMKWLPKEYRETRNHEFLVWKERYGFMLIYIVYLVAN
jgi:hypothetical protein